MRQSSPFIKFDHWFKIARRDRRIGDATAMCVSTISSALYPDNRMVLLKEFDEHGFVFFTNLTSSKGQALRRAPRAAITFFWEPLGRQVRIQGKTEIVSDAEADAYWVTRPRVSQLGAWASKQSRPLSSYAFLMKEVRRYAKQFKGIPVPRPSYWTGIRVIPSKIEFWSARPNRLHDRLLYTRRGKTWRLQRLFP